MPAQPADQTRRALLDEGIRGLLELTPAALLSAVGVKEIARRAGVGATTLYHHFGSLEDFADAVVRQVFDPGEFGVESITEQVTQVRAAALPVAAGRAMHRAEFARVRDDRELRVRVGLWALGGAPMDRSYGDMLRVVDGRIGRFAEALFADWGREPSPPFDTDAFVAAHSALLSGAVIRHLVDPGAIDVERFARTAQSLTMVMLRVQGDRRTLDDRLTEINYYPLHNRQGAALTDRRLRTRGRVLAAAATLFGRQGHVATTVPQVAAAAGVAASTVYALFEGIDDLAVQLLMKQAEDTFARQPEPRERGLAGVAARLEVVAGFLHARSGHAGPYAAALATGAGAGEDPLVATVAHALRGAQDAGEARRGLDADEVARTMLLLVAARVLAAPAGGPVTAAGHVSDLVLPGLALGATDAGAAPVTA